MKVLSGGYVGPDNPHELLVNQKLLNHQIEVICFDKKKVLPLLAACRAHPDAELIHLHWLESLWLSPIGIKSWFKSLRLWLELITIKLLGKKLVWTVHNLQNHENKQLGLEKINQIICGKLADTVVVHCHQARGLIAQKIGSSQDKIQVVEHSSYLGYYPQPRNAVQLRNRYKISSKQTVVLFLGTMRPYKGLPHLIKSFKQIPDAESVLIVAGWADERQKQQLKALVKDDSRIKFIPKKIPEADVSGYFTIADLVVLPYKQILNSGSVMLAYSFGKPVIVPAKGCLAELVTSRNGIVYQQDEDLTAALKKGLNLSKAQKQTMGNNNLALAKRLVSEFEADKTADIYTKLVNV